MLADQAWEPSLRLNPLNRSLLRPWSMPALLDGDPDDRWAGHDWEHWWGDEPAPLLVSTFTSLPGATSELRELTQRFVRGCPEVVEVLLQRATGSPSSGLDLG
jgi:hypothetical protein